MAAAEVDPRIAPVLGPYVLMTALPSSLDPVQPLARAVYETGSVDSTGAGGHTGSRPALL